MSYPVYYNIIGLSFGCTKSPLPRQLLCANVESHDLCSAMPGAQEELKPAAQHHMTKSTLYMSLLHWQSAN